MLQVAEVEAFLPGDSVNISACPLGLLLASVWMCPANGPGWVCRCSAALLGLSALGAFAPDLDATWQQDS